MLLLIINSFLLFPYFPQTKYLFVLLVQYLQQFYLEGININFFRNENALLIWWCFCLRQLQLLAVLWMKVLYLLFAQLFCVLLGRRNWSVGFLFVCLLTFILVIPSIFSFIYLLIFLSWGWVFWWIKWWEGKFCWKIENSWENEDLWCNVNLIVIFCLL